MREKMPEASNSNIHGHIHGNSDQDIWNTGGVEEDLNKKIFLGKLHVILL